MSKTKKPGRASRSAAPRGWAELYVQNERWVADRWKVMFRVNEFEVYCIGAECTSPDCAERLRADFHKALTALGLKLPNMAICLKTEAYQRDRKPQ